MSLRVLVRASVISLAALLLIAFALIQFEEHLIRLQNERLLADFHSLRLNQTSWPEVQPLMQRWGKAGHAHGPCNSIDCAYDITVVGWPSLLPNSNGIALRWLYRLGRLPLLLQFVGLRFSVLELRFLVEDGAVRRTRLHITGESQAGGQRSALLVTVKGDDTLDASNYDAVDTVGADEEIGMHPAFIVGPNGFCTGCENILLVYTPQIASGELERLTSFNLSCLTRMLPCFHLSALAPALMQEDAVNLRDVPRNSVPCTTPTWALARDAKAIWLVETVAKSLVPDPHPLYEKAPSVIEQDQIQLVRILKGPARIPLQTKLQFRPFPWPRPSSTRPFSRPWWPPFRVSQRSSSASTPRPHRSTCRPGGGAFRRSARRRYRHQRRARLL